MMAGTEHVTLILTREEAERLSFGLSDLLCWCAGFRAGNRNEFGVADNSPMGVEATRDMNIRLKHALAGIETPSSAPGDIF